MEQRQDITKRCVEPDCKKDFVVSGSEQVFFEQRKLAIPKRCKDCRARRKKEEFSSFGEVSREIRNKTYGKKGDKRSYY